jgi:hypothetical protein
MEPLLQFFGFWTTQNMAKSLLVFPGIQIHGEIASKTQCPFYFLLASKIKKVLVQFIVETQLLLLLTPYLL